MDARFFPLCCASALTTTRISSDGWERKQLLRREPRFVVWVARERAPRPKRYRASPWDRTCAAARTPHFGAHRVAQTHQLFTSQSPLAPARSAGSSCTNTMQLARGRHRHVRGGCCKNQAGGGEGGWCMAISGCGAYNLRHGQTGSRSWGRRRTGAARGAWGERGRRAWEPANRLAGEERAARTWQSEAGRRADSLEDYISGDFTYLPPATVVAEYHHLLTALFSNSPASTSAPSSARTSVASPTAPPRSPKLLPN